MLEKSRFVEVVWQIPFQDSVLQFSNGIFIHKILHTSTFVCVYIVFYLLFSLFRCCKKKNYYYFFKDGSSDLFCCRCQRDVFGQRHLFVYATICLIRRFYESWPNVHMIVYCTSSNPHHADSLYMFIYLYTQCIHGFIWFFVSVENVSDHIKSFTCGKLYYRTSYLDAKRDVLYVGAM